MAIVLPENVSDRAGITPVYRGAGKPGSDITFRWAGGITVLQAVLQAALQGKLSSFAGVCELLC